MTVAYQGVPGAFGHQACLAFLPDRAPVAQHDFASVVAAVRDGRTALGLLPVENNIAGPVEEVRMLLEECDLPVLATHDLPVRMHLLGLPGSTLAGIRRVASHKMANAQCAGMLTAMGLVATEASNTAIAAQALAADGDEAAAVLASDAAAVAYGLVILRRDMQDRPDNSTRFCVIGSRAMEGRKPT